MKIGKLRSIADRNVIQWAFVLSALVVTSCNGIDEMHWKEEIRLHDGSMIVVERTAAARSSGFPDASRGATIRQELRYAPKGFVFKLSNTSEEPMSLDIFDGKIYLITIGGNRDLFCSGKQPGSYAANFYLFDGGKLVRTDQKSTPVASMLNNLTEGFWGATAKEDPTFISWREQGRRDNFNPDHPRTAVKLFEKYEFLRCP